MNFKQHLINNIDSIIKASKIVNDMDSIYFDHFNINPKEINKETISIVMTTCNRTIQTYFTIETISKSDYKNVQVIIVEDSSHDQIDLKKLESFNVHIDLIKIKNKFWLNPCVNYDLGFKFIKGGIIVVQNAEVCHVGDVISYIHKNIKENEYLVFDVCSILNLTNNNSLYQIKNMTYENKDYILKLINVWYQHHIYSNRKYHFLTALTKNSFDLIKQFDLDYSVGSCYDDDDFLFKIITSGINIINVPETNKVFGIHQWHESTPASVMHTYYSNNTLLNIKKNYYLKNKKHLNLSILNKEEAICLINSLF